MSRAKLLSAGAVALALFPGVAGAKELYWIVNLHAIDLIRGQGAEAAALADRFFDNGRTFVTLKRDGNFSRLPPHAVPTVTFTSYEDLARAIEGSRIDPRFKAVLYDAENWKFTPEKEKLNPALYHEKAAALVHQHGLKLLATPAANLAKAIHPDSTGDRYGEYLRLKIAADAARHADIFEIQAQGSQPAPGKYSRFVNEAAVQAKAANPKVIVLAGLSTNPMGQSVTADQLLEGITKTRDHVDGYWLNIPGGGPYCPSCGEPKPGVAVALLKKLNGAK